jgi:uncharacterized protein (DUF1800 family)
MTTENSKLSKAAINMRTALMRFGLGPKRGSKLVAANANSALEACLKELQNPQAVQIADTELMIKSDHHGGAMVPLTNENCAIFATRVLTRNAPAPSEVLLLERAGRTAKALEPEIGFVERLVHFWSNHFSVNYGKGFGVTTQAGHLERSVIRKHVLGKFSDMLKGVSTHVAMIYYLDNDRSVGPTSKVGIARKIGLNENLAREILELHTLGVRGGYTQTDVTNFAKIITGWNAAADGMFAYDPDAHEPGNFTVMGRNFVGNAQTMKQGLDVLDMLARHPATAQHIAFKLLVHFVTERPTPRMVNALASVFQKTGGDLKAVAEALLRMPESWTLPLNRLRLPQVWMLSIVRGAGTSKEAAMTTRNQWGHDVFLSSLNHIIWGRLTPDGYQEEDFRWLNPNAMRFRRDVAAHLMSYYPDTSSDSGLAIADALMPGMLSSATRKAIESWPAGPTQKGAALHTLFMSPEYLRR